MLKLSVRSRLFVAIFGPTLLLTIVLGGVGLWVDTQTLRESLEREAFLQADLVARASRGPLSLEDTLSLQEVLAALQGEENVILGAIYSINGQAVAQFTRGNIQPPAIPREGRDGNVFSVVRDIQVGTETIGTFLIQVSLQRYHERLRLYLVGGIASLLILICAAAAVASALRKRLLKPLESLTETAKSISENRNYSVRASGFEDAEFGAVTSAFNHMLEQIEVQHGALEKANTELRAANKELEAFTYSVSHDLRTPLRAISAYAQIAGEAEESLPQETQQSLAKIQTSAIKMAQLIDDLLAFSRVDAQPLVRLEVDLDEISKQAWEETLANTRGTKPEVKIEPLGRTQGDERLLRQVFVNLFSNAVKYSRAREKPLVEVGRLSGKDTYFVRDNGVGFDMQYASKLFGVFQRLHSAKEFEGTGVGLAIVQRIVSRHGGRIWANAEPGRGACFFFTLGT